MNTTAKTRTQRRMEKRQALLLLILVLIVSLASFTLGVYVGRQGAERDLAMKQQKAEKILVAPASARPQAPMAPPVEDQPAVDGTAQAKLAESSSTEEPKLSFYDDLDKEGSAKPPLGSGINLPPVEPKPEPVVKPPIELPDQPIVKKQLESAPTVAAVTPTAETQAPIAEAALSLPTVDPKGKYVLQVGSFAAAGDAGKMKQRLLDKDYPAFVVEADLGQKGIWYRVRVGPYADGEAAKAMQLLVEQREKIKGFVTRQ